MLDDGMPLVWELEREVTDVFTGQSDRLPNRLFPPSLNAEASNPFPFLFWLILFTLLTSWLLDKQSCIEEAS